MNERVEEKRKEKIILKEGRKQKDEERNGGYKRKQKNTSRERKSKRALCLRVRERV